MSRCSVENGETARCQLVSGALLRAAAQLQCTSHNATNLEILSQNGQAFHPCSLPGAFSPPAPTQKTQAPRKPRGSVWLCVFRLGHMAHPSSSAGSNMAEKLVAITGSQLVWTVFLRMGSGHCGEAIDKDAPPGLALRCPSPRARDLGRLVASISSLSSEAATGMTCNEWQPASGTAETHPPSQSCGVNPAGRAVACSGTRVPHLSPPATWYVDAVQCALKYVEMVCRSPRRQLVCTGPLLAIRFAHLRRRVCEASQFFLFLFLFAPPIQYSEPEHGCEGGGRQIAKRKAKRKTGKKKRVHHGMRCRPLVTVSSHDTASS